MSRTLTQKKRPAVLATSVAALLGLGLLLGVPRAVADEYWDGTNTGGSGTQNGAGGPGTWNNDPANTNWVDQPGNNPHQYDPTQPAFFSTAGGTVTLGDNITFTSLRFDVNGYVIGNPGDASTLTPSGAGQIFVSGSNTVTINAQITGANVLSLQGDGTTSTITLTNSNNNYSGGTTIGNAGTGPTVVIDNDGDLGQNSGTLTFDGGTLHTTASVVSGRGIILTSVGSFQPDSNTTLELDGEIDGAGALTLSGAGTLKPTNTANSYTGGTNINAGTLVIGADGDLGGPSGVITFGGGALETTASITTSRLVTLNAPGGGIFLPDTGTTLELDGAITGAGPLLMNGAGILLLTNTGNAYAGLTTIGNGTLRAGAVNVIPSTSPVTVSPGATFDLNGFSQNVVSIEGGGAITLGSGTLTTGSGNTAKTFSGSISGTGGLTKVGTATFTLSGANTYTGATTVSAGTLSLTGSLTGSNVSTSGNGIVSESATGVIGGAGVTFTQGSSATTTLAGANTYTGATTVNKGFLLIDPTTNTVLSSSSALVVGGGQFQLNGVPATNTTQILNGLTVNPGSSVVAVNNLGITTTLDLRGPSGTMGITRMANGFVDFKAITGTLGVDAIIETNQANDPASGFIGTWATVNGGSAFAMNNGSGVIVAYNGYTNINAQGDTILDNPNSNVLINAPGTTGPDVIAKPLTRINSLTQGSTTPSTIDTSPGTLRLGVTGGIFITPSGASLTIGKAQNSGVLSAGEDTMTVASQITFENNSGNLLTINSVIADNSSPAALAPVSVRVDGSGIVVFAGNNTYTGSTTIFNGTLQMAATNSIPSKSAVLVDTNGTLNLNNFSQSVGSIADGPTGGGTINLGSANLTTGNDNTSTAFSGVIQGTGGSLTKVGTGTLTLSGTNTYTGGTTLNSGTLNANNNSAFGTGTLTINGGTIGSTLTSNVTLPNAVVVGGNFSIATPGNPNLIFNGTVDLGGATRTITGITPGAQIQFANAISNGGITFTTDPAVGNDPNTPYVAFIYTGSTPNTYTGLTTLNGHAILVFEGTSFDGAIHGDVVVNDNASVDYIIVSGGGTVSNQISNTSTVTINSPGTDIAGGGHVDGLALRGSSDTIGTLNGTNSMATVGLGSGTLTIAIGGNFAGVIEDGPDGGTGGNLTMAGTGTLILSGANTYTGKTTISTGTLQAGADFTTSASSAVLINTGAVFDVNNHTEQVGSIADGVGGGGTIKLGSGTLVAGFDNTSTTFSGVIEDGSAGQGGNFIMVGTGTLTLSGANTYTGFTRVAGGNPGPGGTLQAGAVNTIPLKSAVLVDANNTFDLNNFNQSIGSLADGNGGGTVNLGTATLTLGNDNTDTAFSGVIQGTGGITKVGGGTFFIEGSNTFTGPTTVNGGAIELDGTSVSPVTVNSTGTFILGSGGTLTATPVTVNANGTFNNQGTLTSAATAVVVNDATGVGTVVNSGTLSGTTAAINASTGGGVKIVNFGTITGPILLGPGANTIVLATQMQPVSPTPVIPGGAGNNDTLELAGSAQDSFNVTAATNFEFLNKVGGGLWTITGIGNFPRGTTISGGTIAVQGNLLSNVVIQPAGTLAGTGLVTGNVLNGGMVMPGIPSSVLTPTIAQGTLSVKGNYTQSPTGALVIQINGTSPGQYSQLSIGGHAQLNGTLVLQNGSGDGLKFGQKLTFLTAGGGVSGTFSGVANPFLGNTIVVGKVVYESNDVLLEGVQGSFKSVDTVFHLTGNEKTVAAAVDNAASDPRAAKLLNYLDNERLNKLPGDFDRIAPEEIASVFRIGVSLSDVQARNVQRRAADLREGASGFSTAGFQTTGGPNYSGGVAGANGSEGPGGKTANAQTDERRWGGFITGIGDFAHVGDSANASGYDLNTDGVTVGADYRLTNHLAVGVTAGYAGTDADLANNGRLLVNGGKVGAYGTYYTGGFHADAAVSGGYNSYSTRRGALQGDAYGSTEGGEFDALADAGYDWRLDALTIGPTAAFQYTYVGIDGFTERGSLAPLRYAGEHQASTRSTFGLRAAYDWKIGGVIVRPEGELAWQHEYGDRSYSIDSAFASGAGSMFSVSDTSLGRDSFLFGGGVSVLWNPRTSTYLYYDADLLKKEYYSQSVTGGLRMNF